ILYINATVFAYYNYTVLDKNPLSVGNSTICDGNPEKQEYAVAITRNANYSVEGGPVRFFLSAPLLNEQWYQNNHFDNLILTKRKIYDAEIYLNNKSTGYSEIYRFGVSTDSLGFQRIYSIPNSSGFNLQHSELNESYFPKQLELEKEFFSYIYPLNSTYSGIGENELLLTVKDHFGNNFTSKKFLYSRFLTAGNLTEGNETPGDQAKFRKGAEFNYDSAPTLFLMGGITLFGLFFLAGYNRITK
ncbi:hypothetical protein HZC08_02275, partial [Candidatus Micrarchaeota archaeon]|nr:hypothetical protein [Candidatus Micrarchaeota archaeon]